VKLARKEEGLFMGVPVIPVASAATAAGAFFLPAFYHCPSFAVSACAARLKTKLKTKETRS
jgi:hypothetical protein|tara:strand:- start:584 stop:766 length:183 start_codon:yes stop_codon:yes gene_type:complete